MAVTAKTLTDSVTGTVDAIKSWPQRVKHYFDGLRMEMRRVTWPTRKQVRATTAVVLVTVFLFAVYFGIVDWILSSAMEWIWKLFQR